MIQGPLLTFMLLFYNFFILSSLNNILELSINSYTIFIIVLIIAISRITSMTIERNKTHTITQYLMEFDGIWLWASFMYLFEIIILYVIEQFIIIPLSLKAIFILLIPVLGIIGYYIAHNIYIKEYEIYLNEKSQTQSKPMTIIQISDLHIGSIRREKTLKKVVKAINKIASQKENTQVITVIAGDIADGSCPITPDMFMTFKEATMPVIFTPGNHDYYQGIDNVKTALENAGITILDNENIIYDKENINLIGLKFSFNESEQDDTYQLPIKQDKNNIVIYHAPFYWDEFSKMGVDLELSGHTHGGQFYPAIWFTKRMFKYNRGLFNRQVIQENGTKTNSYLSVTDGVGSFATPIRLGTHSEVVVLDINRVPKKE
ncbi:metallophosphoesterase [Methanosphaera sp. WGK6]|uniref:metallophosphoesterase n=1 Tax=Methanosphaera sp. WGK6 TaxID=1561964 RepID=UPI00084BF350|nr:metallophosphoesterase [Methanosphaera sp. WGK6]